MRMKTATSYKTVNERVEGRWLGNDYVNTKQTTKVSANASATKNQIDWKKWTSDRTNELAEQESGEDVSAWGSRKSFRKWFIYMWYQMWKLMRSIAACSFRFDTNKTLLSPSLSLNFAFALSSFFLLCVFFSYSCVRVNTLSVCLIHSVAQVCHARIEIATQFMLSDVQKLYVVCAQVQCILFVLRFVVYRLCLNPFYAPSI